MVHPEGLEPPTSSSEAKRSNPTELRVLEGCRVINRRFKRDYNVKIQRILYVVGPVGFEPTTASLRGICSTD